jgi:hypothetical protein
MNARQKRDISRQTLRSTAHRRRSNISDGNGDGDDLARVTENFEQSLIHIVSKAHRGVIAMSEELLDLSNNSCGIGVSPVFEGSY